MQLLGSQIRGGWKKERTLRVCNMKTTKKMKKMKKRKKKMRKMTQEFYLTRQSPAKMEVSLSKMVQVEALLEFNMLQSPNRTFKIKIIRCFSNNFFNNNSK
jgi:hypothetical protein